MASHLCSRRLRALVALVLGLTTLGVVASPPAAAAPPANDNLASAQAIAVGSTVSTNTLEATTESGEDLDCNGSAVIKTVWYKFTPMVTQGILLETLGGAPNYDSVVSVFSGPSSSPTFPLAPVACADDGGVDHFSRVSFTAVGGTTYYIQLGNYTPPEPDDPGPGPVQLRMLDAPPANDNLAAATAVASDRTTPVEVNTASATRESGEVTGASCTPDYTRTVWLKYTAATAGSHAIESSGSLDTYLSVWSGPSTGATFGNLTQVACADGGGSGANARALFTAAAGTTYYVQAATKNGTQPGGFLLTFSYPTPPVPANDNLATAASLTTGVATDANTAGATLEGGEVGQAGTCAEIRNTVWYAWAATASGPVVAETLGGAARFDSVLNVWTDDSAPPSFPLSGPVACADQGGADNLSRVQFNATAGTTYYIQLANYSDPTASDPGPGRVQLRVRQLIAPANDHLANAATITLPSTVEVDNSVATKETGEPAQASPTDCDPIFNTVWFKYTPTSTGGVTLDTLGTQPAKDTIVEVWSGPASGPTFGNLTAIACNDDDVSGTRSKVSFLATAGTTYYFQVGSFNETTAVGLLTVALSAYPASATTTTLDAVVTGRDATLNATVGPNSPSDPLTGSVQFFDGATSLGTVPLTAGAASTSVSQLAPGSHSFRAVFTSSDYREGNSEDTDDEVVVVPTTTALTAVASGQTVSLQTTVAWSGGAPHPAGSVEFFEGAVSLGSTTLSNGSAAKLVTGVPPGAHVYRAVFTPTAGSGFTGSTSPDQSVTVTAAPTPAAATTKITAPKKVTVGKKATVTVAVNGAGGPVGGTVTVVVDGKSKTLTLVNGQATFKTQKLKKVGKVTVSATYAATPTTQASSAEVRIKVKKKPKKP